MQRNAGTGRLSRGVLTALAGVAATAGIAHADACVGDIDEDGAVGAIDIVELLSAWGDASAPGARGDLNGDAVVNSSDLAALLASWGSCIALPSWALPIEGSPDPAVVTDPS
ncbi:MAG: dockerin type I domain-containing protein, partial [Planctomycetota bacterium]